MGAEAEFYQYLDMLFRENALDVSDKKRFLFLPFELYALSEKDDNVFIVYEDWWKRKKPVVIGKLYSELGISRRIYGRDCTVKHVTKPEADLFLFQNHILNATNAKVKIALYLGDELVSLATFAGQRQFRNGQRSAELLRFCHKNGCTVVGGLDKLLKAYIKKYKPDELMTYIDLDWGKGRAFVHLGFEIVEKKQPILFYVDKKSGERISGKYFKEQENKANYAKIKNKGSLKMIKRL